MSQSRVYPCLDLIIENMWNILFFMVVTFAIILASYVVYKTSTADAVTTSVYIRDTSIVNFGRKPCLYEEIPWRLDRRITIFDTYEEAKIEETELNNKIKEKRLKLLK